MAFVTNKTLTFNDNEFEIKIDFSPEKCKFNCLVPKEFQINELIPKEFYFDRMDDFDNLWHDILEAVNYVDSSIIEDIILFYHSGSDFEFIYAQKQYSEAFNNPYINTDAKYIINNKEFLIDSKSFYMEIENTEENIKAIENFSSYVKGVFDKIDTYLSDLNSDTFKKLSLVDVDSKKYLSYSLN